MIAATNGLLAYGPIIFIAGGLAGYGINRYYGDAGRAPSRSTRSS